MKHTLQTQDTIFDVLFQSDNSRDYQQLFKELRFASLQWSVNPRDFIIEFNWICPECGKPVILDNPFVTHHFCECPHCESYLAINWEEKKAILSTMEPCYGTFYLIQKKQKIQENFYE